MSLLSRAFSSRYFIPSSFQRVAFIRCSRVYSSSSNDGGDKPSKAGISSLLSSLKEKDKNVDLKDVLKRGKPMREEPLESKESLKEMFLKTENDVKTVPAEESVKGSKETVHSKVSAENDVKVVRGKGEESNRGMDTSNTSDASDTLKKVFKRDIQDQTVTPEMHDKLKSILSKLKVDSAQTNLSKDIVGAAKSWGRVSPRYRKDIISDFKMQSQTYSSKVSKVISLTDGPRFNFFDEIYDHKVPLAEPASELGLLEGLEMELLQKHESLDQRNDFISLMEISDKQWKFPVDNEVCKVEEEGVGFEEHVFLGYLLDGFPKKGPVRRFMELVINGLEQNPHMTVGQKQQQVQWFKQYFDNVPEEDLSF